MRKITHKDSYGFTFAELIVVITILTVLSTLGFLSFVSYTVETRDTARITDVKSIETTLDFFHAYAAKYPSPTSGVDIGLNGAVAWNQGVF
jgi:prepilin-type N-terminal cleavage/methylation domain-containing protein